MKQIGHGITIKTIIPLRWFVQRNCLCYDKTIKVRCKSLAEKILWNEEKYA